MTESPLMSRQAVRDHLGVNEATLKGIVARGELRTHERTGNFARVQVEAYAKKIEEEILNGNVGQFKGPMEIFGGNYRRAQIPLR